MVRAVSTSFWWTTIPQPLRDVRAPRRKQLTERDREEWAVYVQRVSPLPGREVPDPPTPPDVVVLAVESEPAMLSVPVKRLPQPPRTIAVGDAPSGLDKSSWNRLRTGKLTPQRTLDLHGRTAQRAFHALQAFLAIAQADGLRCVEVITGKGSGETGGVIKREFPMWINLPTLRPLVLAASHPHAANSGSVRLLLRRPR